MDFGLDDFILSTAKIYWLEIVLFFLTLMFLLLVLTVVPLLLRKYFVKRSFFDGAEWRNNQNSLRALREMEPSIFEQYIADLFTKLGYKASVTGRSGDHGIDVKVEKNGITSYVQCKRYSDSNKVGEPEVRNFLGSLDHMHSGSKGYFITTNVFTLAAEKFAEDKPIELVDGPRLIEYINLAEMNKG